MKKDGLMGKLLTAMVEEEKEKAKNKQPDWFMNEKKGMWYMLMNQIDSLPEEDSESNEDGEEGSDPQSEAET